MASTDQKPASFAEELAKARAKKKADSAKADDSTPVGDGDEADAALRDKIRGDSKAAAREILPELWKAIRALQSFARPAAAQSQRPVDGVRVVTQVSLLKRVRVTYWDVEVSKGAYGDTRVIRVPRTGVPTAYRPGGHQEPRELSLESFADEGHWWWSVHDNWESTTEREADAADDFRTAIETIAHYLAQIT